MWPGSWFMHKRWEQLRHVVIQLEGQFLRGLLIWILIQDAASPFSRHSNLEGSEGSPREEIAASLSEHRWWSRWRYHHLFVKPQRMDVTRTIFYIQWSYMHRVPWAIFPHSIITNIILYLVWPCTPGFKSTSWPKFRRLETKESWPHPPVEAVCTPPEIPGGVRAFGSCSANSNTFESHH